MKHIRRRSRIIMSFLLIASVLTISVFSAGPVPKAVMQSVNSVVRIEVWHGIPAGHGTGFVIKSDRDSTLIVTNHHVIDGSPDKILVYIGRDQTVSAHILADAPAKDMCVLELAYPVSIPALTLEKQDADRGEAVYAVGFPGAAEHLSSTEILTNEEATITDGIISAVRQTQITNYGPMVTLLQTNAEINPGNSGGPLFNEKGNVVGINTFTVLDSQGIFAAVAVSELRTFLLDNRIDISGKGSVSGVAATVVLVGILVVAAAAVRKKKKAMLTLGIAVPLILAAAYLGTWGMANMYAGREEFDKAAQWAILPTPDSRLNRYIAAGVLMDNRDFNAANAAFANLQDYKNASALALESLYRFAAQQADVGNYSKALSVFTELKDHGQSERLNELKAVIYQIGESTYSSGDYQMAQECFLQVYPYERTESYLKLCAVHLSGYTSRGYDDVMYLLGFADTRAILVSDASYAVRFLEGDWQESGGKHTLSMDAEGTCASSLPCVLKGNTDYFIMDGVKFSYNNGNRKGAVADWFIQVVDSDTILVLCHADDNIYTLYRK